MLKNKRVCISMLARDCCQSLKRNISKVVNLYNNFSENSVIQIIENDSIDGTKDLLRGLKEQYSFIHVLSEDTNQITYNKNQQAGAMYRINKMTMFRNKYLELLEKESFDFLIVIDADLYDFYPDKIISCIENAPNDWSGLFANGKYFYRFFSKNILLKYYDLFAYVPFKENGYVSENNYELTYKEMALSSDYLNYKRKKLPDYIECRSAFGGIGIYNLLKYQGQKYSTKKNDRSHYFDAVCEHISFNRIFNEYGKLYICKEMIALYEQQGFIKLLFYPISNKFKFFIYEKILHKEIYE